MSSISLWGPSTWIFFHTLAEKIKEDKFIIIKSELHNILLQISYNLPCPDCANHAKIFWSKVNFNNVNTKTDLKNILFTFHNIVNKRKNKQLYKYEDLNNYKNNQLIQSFNNFIKNFHTHGNMKLINESWRRTILLLQIKKWFLKNLQNFEL